MTARDERGFALVAVLLVLAILGVVGAEFALSMRLEASAVRAYKDGVTGLHLAESAVEQAIREIAQDYSYVAMTEEGLTLYRADRLPIPRLPRTEVTLGAHQFSYVITDEESRLNVNLTPPDRMERLLVCAGMTNKAERDAIVDSIQDWRDANEEHRLNGAESDDYYLKLPVPYRARNANIDSIHELLQVKGMTEALFFGTAEQPGLRADLTAKTPGPVNINSATARVLCALGFGAAEISQVEQTRRDGAYAAVPGQFGGRNLIVTSRTFRIEASGIMDGRVVAHVTAVVQKRQARAGATILPVEWTVDR
jgi:general secretion pathway protein K